jgi:branched-chain amino acid transport system substrate-binding protein
MKVSPVRLPLDRTKHSHEHRGNRARRSPGTGLRAVSACLAMLLGVLLVAAVPGAKSGAGAKPVRLGVSTILSGPLSLLGQETKEGAQLAAEQINARGGVLGRPISLSFADNACDPAQGINAVGSLVYQNKVAAFVGSGCSSVTLAVMPVIDRAKVVQLEYIATNPKITQLAGVGGNKWQFRLNIDDGIMAKALSDYIAEQVKSVAIIARNDDYGRGAAAAFRDSLTPKGVRVTNVEYAASGTVDYRAILTKIKGANPEGLIIIDDAPDAAPIALQYTELGMTQKIYGRGTVVTPQFQALVHNPKIWDGAVEINRWAPNPGSKDFEVAYEKSYGRAPELTAAMAYYAIHVLAAAVKLAGSDDRAGIRDALERLSLNFPGLGPVKFDAHHQAHPDMFLVQWQNGKIVTLTRRPTQ